MASRSSTIPEIGEQESRLLHRLLALYEEELQIYRQVLDLSQRQGELIRQGVPLAEIRRLLEQKKNCLNIIGRLEATERNAKKAWENGRREWSAHSRTRLHEVLGRVGQLIEQILICEEENDLQLIQQTRAV